MASFPARCVAAGLAGLLLVAAFPPFDLWWLAPVAVAGVTVACRGVSGRGGAVLGLVAGLAFFVPLLSWSGVYVGRLPWLLLAGYQASYLAALGAALAVVQRLRWWPVWTACLWVAAEALRARWPFDGFTWGRLAFAQADAPTLGLAALAGAPAITFAVALSGSLLAWAAVGRGAGRRLSAAVLAAAVMLAGLVVPMRRPAGQEVTVGLVQGNVPRLGLDFNAQREAVLRNHAQATQQLAADVAAGNEPPLDLVLWPENASDIDPYRNASAGRLIDHAAQAVGVPILVGAMLVSDDGAHLENRSVVWDPVTGSGASYLKRHPVPFAEYIPLRPWARLVSDKVDLVRRDQRAGDRVGLLQVGPAAVGTLICFEVAYDDLPREAVRAGGQLIAVQTNNATFGFTSQTEQQLVMSRVRAVEHARSVLVVSTSGVSAVVGPRGDVEQRAELFTRAALVASVRLSDAQTLATRVGAWPEALLTVIALGAVVAGVRAGRRRTFASASVAPAGDVIRHPTEPVAS